MPHGASSATFLVEPVDASICGDEVKETEFRAEIIRRFVADENVSRAERQPRERLSDDPGLISLVPYGSLPTSTLKGSIRRKAVLDEFAGVIESLYTCRTKQPAERYSQLELNVSSGDAIYIISVQYCDGPSEEMMKFACLSCTTFPLYAES